MEEQLSLINAIKDYIPEDSSLYLDITNGLRIMPLSAYSAALCLRETKSIKIKDIFYNREIHRMNDTTGKIATINKWINCLNTLAENSDSDFVKGKIDEVNAILPNQKNKTSNTPPKPQKNSVCILSELSNYINNARNMNLFLNTGDIRSFTELFERKNLPTDDLQNVGKLLDLCWYKDLDKNENNDALERVKTAILNATDDKDARDIINNNLNWIPLNKNPQRYRDLSSFYASSEDYLRSVNACYYKIMELETSQGVRKGEKINSIIAMYSKKDYTEFQENFRAAFIHKDDKSNLNSKFKNNFRKELKENLREFGITTKTLIPKNKNPKKVFISFIGSGDYIRTNYKYIDPTNPKDTKYSLENSLFIGNSLAMVLKDKDGLNEFLIVGSYTSSWPVFLDSFKEQFQLNGGALDDFNKLQASIRTEYENPKSETKKFGLLPENQEQLNEFFDKYKREIGLKIRTVMTSEDIHLTEVQTELCNLIANSVANNDSLWIDLTHSYRMMPVLTTGVLTYLRATKNITIERIFYGDIGSVTAKTNECEINNLKRKLIALKRQDIDFSSIKEQLEKVFKDIPETYINL